MQTYLATEYRRDGAYSVTLDALSWDDAERECEERGWSLTGELMAVIPADQISIESMDALVSEMNEARGATRH